MINHLIPRFWLLTLICITCNPKTPATFQQQTTPAETLQASMDFFADKPHYLKPFPYTKVPAGLPDLTAATCGACHSEIYQEWRISTHARAWRDDAQFMEEYNKPEFNGSGENDVRWMCVNCHTPLMNQLERLVVGLQEEKLERPIQVDNPFYDPKLQLEAVTCAACHVRDGVILGPYGDTKAPHPVKKEARLQQDIWCMQCHQANAHFPEIALSCTFDTGSEFAAGPYKKEGYTCQSCHMPEITRPLAGGGFPQRQSRRHWFGGSLIPKHPRFAAELKPLEAHYPDGLSASWRHASEMPAAGQNQTAVLVLENAEAGHNLPTGDPERFILVEVSILDEADAPLLETRIRIGTQYQWRPTVKKLSDNRLKPKEIRRYPLQFKAPEKGIVRYRIKASKWRISEENFNYHNLADRYVAGRVFLETEEQRPVKPAGPQ